MPGVVPALAAIEKYLEAVRDDSHQEVGFTQRVGTVLLWMCAVDERFWNDDHYEDERLAHPDGLVFDGLRRARDAITHQLVVTHPEGGIDHGASDYALYPPAWARLDALGPGKQTLRSPNQDDGYVRELEGRNVIEGLERGDRWLRYWAAFRERAA